MTNLNIELKNDYMHGSSKTWLLQNYHSTLKHYDLLEIRKATIAISLINIMIIKKSSFKNKINDVQSWTEFRYWNGASIQSTWTSSSLTATSKHSFQVFIFKFPTF
jgi:hypothetical protein